MPTNLSSMDAVLKNDYLGPIREQLNNTNEMVKRIGTDSDSVSGKNFTIPMHVSRNQGVGARAEGASLMTAGQQGYKESIFPMRYLYARIKLTGQSMAASKNNAGAFIRALDAELKGAMKDLKNDYNRMLLNDGTGRLTTCGTTSNATTVAVASTRFLQVGMPIDVVVATTGATSTGALGRTVDAILSATTFTISGAAITTDNTFAVYRAGSRNLEVMGISGIVSASDIGGGYGSLQNLAVASFPWFKSTVLGNSGTPRAISDTLLQRLVDDVGQTGDGEVSALYTSYGVRRAYQALLQTQKQFTNVMKLEGGVSTNLMFNDIPMIVDKMAPTGKVFGLDESMLKIFKMADFDWMDKDGAILSRVSGEDAYEAILYGYLELATFARNAHGVLEDITEA